MSQEPLPKGAPGGAKGRIFHLNVKPRTPGERGLPKTPVDTVLVTRAGVQGDYNVYRQEEKRGDPDSALLILPLETLSELNSEGWPVNPGDLGENFTTTGIEYSALAVGKKLRAGGAVIQISRACEPCDNLYLLPYVGETKGPAFIKATLGRRGWYARVLVEGKVTKGDEIVEEIQPLSNGFKPNPVAQAHS